MKNFVEDLSYPICLGCFEKYNITRKNLCVRPAGPMEGTMRPNRISEVCVVCFGATIACCYLTKSALEDLEKRLPPHTIYVPPDWMYTSRIVYIKPNEKQEYAVLRIIGGHSKEETQVQLINLETNEPKLMGMLEAADLLQDTGKHVSVKGLFNFRQEIDKKEEANEL